MIFVYACTIVNIPGLSNILDLNISSQKLALFIKNKKKEIGIKDFFKKITNIVNIRGVSKVELRVIEPPLLIF